MGCRQRSGYARLAADERAIEITVMARVAAQHRRASPCVV
jgi:hypothetical protein